MGAFMRTRMEVLGIKFDNPLLPASGPTVGSLHSLKFFNETKIGGLVTKTISIQGADVKKPCIVAKNNIIHNTELWSEHSLETWVNDILPPLKEELKKPLIVCAGYTAEDFKQSVPVLEEYADFFEVSTHYGKDGLESLVSAITSLTDKPVFIKLSPHVSDYIGFIDIAVKCGAKGVVAMNSVGPGVAIDLNTRAVSIGVNEGVSWISGPAIKPIALERVMNIRKAFPDLPIIACGGVASAEDILEFILAGADLVQMLSEALLKGRQLYNKIVEDLPEVMDKYGIESLKELRGMTLKRQAQGMGGYPIIDHAKCIKCNKCVNVCPEIAMSLDKILINDETRCIRCGLCESLCPVGALRGVISCID
jgi:dihydroorotate dehydrogenase (fumarate)